MMMLVSYFAFFSGIATLALGGYALYVNRRAAQNRQFFAVCLCLGWWSLAFTFFYIAPTRAGAWLWFTLSLPGWVVTPALLLHFFLIIIRGGAAARRPGLLAALYLPPAAFMYRGLSAPFIATEMLYADEIWHAALEFASPWAIAYIVYSMAYIGACLALALVRGRRGTRSGERREANVLALVLVAAIVPMAITGIILPGMGLSLVPQLLLVFILIWVSGIWYAVIRYRFMMGSPTAAADDIFSVITDYVFLLNPEGVIAAANHRVHEALGYEEGGLAGVPVASLIEGTLPEASGGEGTGLFLKTRAGGRIPVRAHSVGTDKGVTGAAPMVAVFEDTRPERRAHLEAVLRTYADERLYEKSEQIDIVLGNTNDLIIRVDGKGVIRYASPSHKSQLGWDPEKMIGKHAWDVVPREDRRSAGQSLLKGRDEQSPGVLEIQLQHADGHSIWAESIGKPVKNSEGEITGAVIVSRDITERREAAERIKRANAELDLRVRERTAELRESEERYRSLVENIDEVIFTQDLEGRFTYVSPVIEKHSGYTAAEMLNIAYSDFIHPDDLPGLVEGLRTTLEGKVEPIEYRAFDRDGSVRHIRSVSRLVQRAGVPTEIVGVIADMTRVKLLEGRLREHAAELEQTVAERTTELRGAKKILEELAVDLEAKQKEAELTALMAQAAHHVKSEFISNISHEMVTPLNAIIGFAQLIESGLRDGRDAGLRENAGRILDGGKRLLALINNIIEFAQIKYAEIKLEKTRIELVPLLEGVCSIMEPQAARRGIDLRLSANGSAGTELLADRKMLKQIVFNLLSNAVKFTPEGGRVELKAAHRAEGGTGAVEIRVADTGIGIEKEDMARLFSAFTQLDSSSTKKYGGAGLGLVLTKYMVDMHGGTIGVESTPGSGSVFSVLLPSGGEDHEAR